MSYFEFLRLLKAWETASAKMTIFHHATLCKMECDNGENTHASPVADGEDWPLLEGDKLGLPTFALALKARVVFDARAQVSPPMTCAINVLSYGRPVPFRLSRVREEYSNSPANSRSNAQGWCTSCVQ